MDLYHIALFLHIVTLLVATVATAITKLAAGRREQARTVGEALDWHKMAASASKWFPICVASFVITGFYMLSVTHVSAFSTGYVLAGVVGVILLLANGAFLGAKEKALEGRLEGLAAMGADQPMPKLAPPAAAVVLPMVNPMLALGVVFDMVMKPVNIPEALGVLAIGIVVGVALAMKRLAAEVEDAPAA